ncbi:MAG TPA: hypothetical protein VH024_08045, partial [Candidatus Angelobacter sp.]|nr:hypothetical protein [Candidatus Angelobacter sp.]
MSDSNPRSSAQIRGKAFFGAPAFDLKRPWPGLFKSVDFWCGDYPPRQAGGLSLQSPLMTLQVTGSKLQGPVLKLPK